MSLIEKEVEVGLNGNNIEYYKNLGYEMPMKKATKNTWYKYHKEYVVDKSRKIRVKIEHLQNGSRVKVSLKCDECGKITKSTYVDYLSHNHNGKTYCNKCSSKVLCSGEKAYNYRHDLTKEERENSRYRNLNPEYSKMVKAVLKRDNYTCQCCHKRIDEKGVVHHIEGYASNKELGEGYSVITFTSLDEKIAVIIKINETDKKFDKAKLANLALDQIEHKEYYQDHLDYSSVLKIYCFGICFCKKSCSVAFKEIKK